MAKESLRRSIQSAGEQAIAPPMRESAQGVRRAVREVMATDEVAAFIREIRIRAGLPAESRSSDVRDLRARQMRQADDMNQRYYGLGYRPMGTDPIEIDSTQLRTEPTEDLSVLLDEVRVSEGGARLVIGGGHNFRPAEPGEVFVNVDAESRPDVVADLRDLSIFPDGIFDEVHLERVPLWNSLQEGGASELNRVLRNGGQLIIGTGINNMAPATERLANIHALEAAGFGNIEYTVVRDDMMDPDSPASDWYEISATK
ncbi:hypothetical protein [Nocardia pneumoniae]|uniref:hypothetical protein n=1 Tax=Nocardia pneumoniae TaxID=228601 RepID=UPI0012F6DB5A|nr:hypothetical protein [Nocardia pneumoniae]